MSSNPPASFTHLEVHSHFALLGGTSPVADLAARAAAEGMSHLALTDTNVLYGAVAFDRACRAAGVQAIAGMAVTMVREMDLPPVGGEAPGHLVLLATGPGGYRSLCRLSSLIQASTERDALAARGLSWADLEAHREGLICLSGGRSGWLERMLRAGDEAAARAYTARLAGIYRENTYLSLELHQPEDEPIAWAVTEMGRRLGLPCAAVQPVYCLSREEAPRLRLLAAIDRNCRLEAVPAAALPAMGDPTAAEFDRTGSPQQLALPFDRPGVPPESPARRLAWEQLVLGLPVSVHPLELVAGRPPSASQWRSSQTWPGDRLWWPGCGCPAGPAARAFTWGMARPSSSPEGPNR